MNCFAINPGVFVGLLQANNLEYEGPNPCLSLVLISVKSKNKILKFHIPPNLSSFLGLGDSKSSTGTFIFHFISANPYYITCYDIFEQFCIDCDLIQKLLCNFHSAQYLLETQNFWNKSCCLISYSKHPKNFCDNDFDDR